MTRAVIGMPRHERYRIGSQEQSRRCSIEIDGIAAAGGASLGSAASETLASAQAHHNAGRLREAEALYRQVLDVSPSHPDALHLLGMIAYQVGRNELAVDYLHRALQAKPSDAEFHHDLGVVLQALGKPEDALACYRKALAIKPDYLDSHFNMGTVQQAQGKLDDALASYVSALAIDPRMADAHINLGTVLHRQGKLDQAVESYRRSLAIDGGSADAHYNLANALRDQGRPDDAVESYGKALAIQPQHALAHNNLGAVLRREGRLDEAAGHFRRALAFRPDYADAHCNLGSVLRDRHQLPEAIASFRAAISFRSDHAVAHNELGNALAEEGKLDEAAASYRRALAARPDFAEAHNQLGIVEKNRGNLDAAGACFLAATAIDPVFAVAHNNLGNVLNELGRVDAAIASYRRALAVTEAPEFKMSFVRCIRLADFRHVDPEVRHLVTRALSEPWARPSDLAGAAMKLLALDGQITGCIERAAQAWPSRLSREELFGPEGLRALSGDALLRALLSNAQVCSPGFERLFTMVRHAMLDAASDPATEADSEERALAFYCAVARQCFLGEYVYAFTADEIERARRLRDQLEAALQSESTVPAMWVVAVAAYFPLVSVALSKVLRNRPWPDCVFELLAQQIDEPLQEQEFRKAMPALTTIEDPVSRKVRQQYEENPYPRWMKLPPAGATHSLDVYLREQFPYVPFVPSGKDGNLDILVAGCGTGQESIEMAQQFPEARVLAVDLSLSSLAYARRKSDERGLTNVDYAQGDINKLGSLPRTFDVISSVGVLHHLEDPMAGWRQLLALLRPGGLMLLGFYSERARQTIVAARAFIAEHGYGSTTEEIRRCREALTSAENAGRFAQLTTFRDFYVTSEIRDLLFHVQEHRFTLPQIKVRLAELGLSFVGFLLEPHVVGKYTQRFPGDKTRTDLNNWNAFEAEFPDTFVSTYAFWVQKLAV